VAETSRDSPYSTGHWQYPPIILQACGGRVDPNHPIIQSALGHYLMGPGTGSLWTTGLHCYQTLLRINYLVLGVWSDVANPVTSNRQRGQAQAYQTATIYQDTLLLHSEAGCQLKTNRRSRTNSSITVFTENMDAFSSGLFRCLPAMLYDTIPSPACLQTFRLVYFVAVQSATSSRTPPSPIVVKKSWSSDNYW
jgi:hypothetical protein